MENTNTKSLEEQLADANARIAELESQNSDASQAPADNGSQAGGEGDEAPAASAPAAESIPAAEAEEAPAAPTTAEAPAASDSEIRLKALEDGQKEIQASIARLGTQQAIAGAEVAPVGTPTADNGQTDNNNDNLTGLAATEAAFEKELKSLQGGN